MNSQNSAPEGGSQTLSRGLRALTLIGEAETPLTVPALAAELGVHRSIAYRIVTALERQGFVERTAGGTIEIGTAVFLLARNVAASLQSVAERELAIVADELNMTAFLSVLDGEMVVTLNSVVPTSADMTVAHRPGSRHSIDRGAPGRVIRSQVDPISYPPKRFEASQDEVLPGLASIAVPLRISGGKPASIAVVFPPLQVDSEHIVDVLETAAQRIEAAVR